MYVRFWQNNDKETEKQCTVQALVLSLYFVAVSVHTKANALYTALHSVNTLHIFVFHFSSLVSFINFLSFKILMLPSHKTDMYSCRMYIMPTHSRFYFERIVSCVKLYPSHIYTNLCHIHKHFSDERYTQNIQVCRKFDSSKRQKK